jgi:RND superfamily putative drug exporter
VIVGWFAALAVAVVAGGALKGDFRADYATPGSDSRAARDLLAQKFPGRAEDGVSFVWTSPQGANSRAVRARVDRILGRAAGLTGIAGRPSTRDAQISRNGRVGVVQIGVDRLATTVPRATGERLRALAQRAGPGLTAAVESRTVPGVQDDAQPSSELIGIAAALVVLLLTLGTVLAAGLPLLTAVFGLGISASLIGVLAAVMDVPDWATQLGAMIGLGVGIDYVLLIVTRHRAALARGLEPDAAAAEAMSTAGRSVLVAGSTVVVSMLGLFLMRLPYLYGPALAAMISVLVVMAVAATLVPALLVAAGQRLERLRVPGVRGGERVSDRTPAARWARAVQRRPLAGAVAATAVLLVLAFPATGMRLGFPDAGNDRSGTSTRTAYDLLAQGFGPGSNGPLTVVARTPTPEDRAAFRRLDARLRNEGGVLTASPVQPSADGRAGLVLVTPDGPPQAKSTTDLVKRLRGGPIATSGLRDVHVGGATASSVDQSQATTRRLPLFIGGVVGLSLLLLLLAFRAPLVALKAGAMNLLSIGAAYGVVAVVAQGGWAGRLVGIDTEMPVAPFIPVIMFAVLFGLSMDYEVFLLSRVREEFDRHGDAARSVVDGVARTARVITAAAAIMVAVFGAFAFSSEVTLKLIGIGLASAILIDATIVRMVLVPSVMQLLGRTTWWSPAWLDRLLPRIAVEAPAPVAGATQRV